MLMKLVLLLMLLLMLLVVLLLTNQRIGERRAHDNEVERAVFGGGDRLEMVHRLMGGGGGGNVRVGQMDR